MFISLILQDGGSWDTWNPGSFTTSTHMNKFIFGKCIHMTSEMNAGRRLVSWKKYCLTLWEMVCRLILQH